VPLRAGLSDGPTGAEASRVATVVQKKAALTPAQKYQGSPVHLTAIATVPASANAGGNSQALHNPVNVPILIRGFKFGFNTQIVVPATNYVLPYASGAALSISIDLNGEAFTKDFIPIWALGPCTNLTNEQLSGQKASSGNAYIYGEYIWTFRSPLLVLPTDQLNFAFQQTGQVSNPLNARISAYGKTASQLTKVTRRILPYAAAYSSKVFQAPFGNAVDSDSSTEQDLWNQTDQFVRLQRFVGRMDLWTTSASTSQSAQHVEGPLRQGAGLTGQINADDVAANLMSCQLFTGHGNPITPYPALFRTVFAGPTRSWELNDAEIAPGDYYICSLSLAANPLFSPQSGFTNQAQAFVGMIGEREVPL
jgi:hypothetical protein